MSVGKVVFVRHGRTAYNAAMRLQGQVDIELDDVGLWQAQTGAQSFVRTVKATKIVASDLSRAHATARAIGALTGHVVPTDSRLRERSFGPWEGMTRPEIDEQWPTEFALWSAGKEPNLDGMESKAVVAERMLAAIADHGADLTEKDTLVLVSHGAAITCAIMDMIGQDPSSWRGVGGLQNVHWSKLSRNTAQGAQPTWRLEEHNVGLSAKHGSQTWANGIAN